MGRKKLDKNKKKVKTGVTINIKLNELLDYHLGEKNRSVYIEGLIISDLKDRGFDIEEES